MTLMKIPLHPSFLQLLKKKLCDTQYMMKMFGTISTMELLHN